MRYAVLIIGLVLTVGLFSQALLGNALMSIADDEAGQEATSIGLVMSLVWLIACGLVIPKPRISMVLFLLAALVGAAGWSSFPDLQFWSAASVVLGLMAYLGYRGKRKDEAKERERDELLRQMAGYQAAMAGGHPQGVIHEAQYRTTQPAAIADRPSTRLCRSCGEPNPIGSRFCANCGASQG